MAGTVGCQICCLLLVVVELQVVRIHYLQLSLINLLEKRIEKISQLHFGLADADWESS